MFEFLGIQLGNMDYRLQQIVLDADAKPVQKTFDIVFWVVAIVQGGTLYVPISKYDMEHNRTLVTSQLASSYTDRTRTLIQKTPRGTVTLPFGAILQR